MSRTDLPRRILFLTLMLACLLPQIHPPIALLMGAIMGLLIGNPFPKRAAAASKSLLKLSVIGLGFGITASQVASVGLDAAFYTAIWITGTFGVGWLLVRLIPQSRITALLITAGTAICGGSAIAALAPAVRAKDHETSIALATVFTLNAVALLIFPPIGHALNLSETQFGVWA
ncbi:MAG: YeiH family protein, partial [Phycisphaerales bacterium JB047]